ncbi:MAG: membrane protein insertion efficiency factor YidD [Clostridia bacterium]|nr:membrane protein insertion efficiency factor YidD [Clostridia bacterium]
MLKKIVLFPVRLYRKYLSPLTPPSCRFNPTCSQYCIDAVEEWGIICGLGLALWRILRCNPWSRGGDDPVPPCPWRRKK